jgi:hypothetical protein
LRLAKNREDFEAIKRDRDLRVADRSPYGADSEHSWFRDSCAVQEVGSDPLARERLNRFRASFEKEQRAVSTSVLSFVSGIVLPPFVQEAVSFGVRSTAPLALALLRLDLPPTGDSASWAKVTTGATVAAGSQSAENAALTASTDPVVGSVEDNLKTLGRLHRRLGPVDRAVRPLGRPRARRGTWPRVRRSAGVRTLDRSGNGWPDHRPHGDERQQLEHRQREDARGSDLKDLRAVRRGRDEPRRDPRPHRDGTPPRGWPRLPDGGDRPPVRGRLPADVRERIVVSSAARVNLGAGTNEDWLVIMNRASTPLVAAPEPTVQVQRQQAGNTLNYRMILYAYVALGVSRRPEGVGLVKGLTAPAYA